MDEEMIQVGIVYAIPIVLVIIVIVCFFIKQDIDHKNRIREDEANRQRKSKEEKAYFERCGYSITKQVGKLIIDDIHKKWMLSDTRDIYDYSDICSAKIREEKNNEFVSLYIDIKMNNANTPLILYPMVKNWPADGNISMYTDNFKNPAIEMEAILNAVSSQDK